MAKSRLQRGLRSTLLGLVVNTVLVGIKFSAGFAGHSNALVADAVESLADIFSSLVVWRLSIVSEAPADEDHPYGHGKAEPIASAVVVFGLPAAGSSGRHPSKLSDPIPRLRHSR